MSCWWKCIDLSYVKSRSYKHSLNKTFVCLLTRRYSLIRLKRVLKYGETHGINVNKSHAACYAAIAMQTAYLKAHYPTEFYAGLLTSVMDDTKQLAVYLNDAKKNGVQVLPPDINSSKSAFSVADDYTLYYGLNSIKKVGKEIIDAILEEKTEYGEFKSLYDFISRCPKANKGLIESLIKAGAFDFTGHNRPSLIENIPVCQKAIKSATKKVCEGQVSIFDFMEIDESINEPEVEKKADWNPVEKAMNEREVAGIFITLHPLDAVPVPKNIVPVSKLLADVKTYIQLDRKASVCGIITEKKVFLTKSKGEKMGILKIEDDQSSMKVVLFPRKYAEIGDGINENDIVSVVGKVNIDEDYEEVSLYADNIENLSIEKTLYVMNREAKTREEAEAVKHRYYMFLSKAGLYKNKVDGYSVKLCFKTRAGKTGVLDLGLKVNDIYLAENFLKKEFGAENVVIKEKKRF